MKLAGYSQLQLRRLDEAVPLLQRPRRSILRPGPPLALGRAHLQRGDYSAAIPLIQPHLGTDSDGSLHVQLARDTPASVSARRPQAAYQIAGTPPRVGRAQCLGGAAQDRAAALTVTPNSQVWRPGLHDPAEERMRRRTAPGV